MLDVFEKDDWEDKKSITFRYYMRDLEKTLSKEEIEEVSQKVTKAVEKLGISIR